MDNIPDNLEQLSMAELTVLLSAHVPATNKSPSQKKQEFIDSCPEDVQEKMRKLP